jgi:hypothetical protein
VSKEYRGGTATDTLALVAPTPRQESLAHSFEGMGLFEDALMQYNELEASFFQVLKGALL